MSKAFYKPCSKKFGLSIWMPYWFIDTNTQHYKFQQPGYYDFNTVIFSNYITHILGISPIILGQYLALISDVISWVEEEHEIMSDKGFFKQFMSEK